MPMRKVIPHVVRSQLVVQVGPDATVGDAARLMASHGIGAVMVMESGALVGILTERDVTNRVVGAGRDPGTTKVGEAMTRDPQTVDGDASALSALGLMREGRFRHLPIVKDGVVLGMVSIRDLFDVVSEQLTRQLAETEALLSGSGYADDPPSIN